MPQHETKNCPRCGNSFECKLGNVLECQCNSIQLGFDERNYVENIYTDCLCIHCLHVLRYEHQIKKKHID